MPNNEDTEHEQTLGRQRRDPRRLWRLFCFLARQYLRYAPYARLNFAWVVFLSLVRSAFIVIFSYISRDFWTALQHKDAPTFWRQIVLFTIVLISALPILVWYSYEKDRLALRWRRWHTEKVLVDYMANRNYYEIDQRANVDNPDQRISQDVENFTKTALDLFINVLSATLDLVNFSFILFTIYPKLFIVLITYATLGTVCAVLIGRRLINLNFKQLQREADFRYSLIRVRENAESIAFYKGEPRERMEVLRRFFTAFENKIALILWQRNLNFFTSFYENLIQVLPLSVVAPIYFTGSIEMGVVSQSLQAFNHILNDLSLIIREFDRISEFSAGVDRLGEFEEFLYERFGELEDRRTFIPPESTLSTARENVSTSPVKPVVADEERELATIFGRYRTLDTFRRFRARQAADTRDHSSDADLLAAEGGALDTHIDTIITDDDHARIEVNNLTLVTPDHRRRVLFSEMSFTLESGQRLLIAGPSGTGKSSALRALAGLWTKGSGKIERPKLENMFFLPQKPYCTLGSLREQLVYPKPVSEVVVSDDQLMSALEVVGLGAVPGRMGGLDSEYDWANVLSLGEQQRLAFARLIIGRPSLAILDECSSALDVASEDRLYSYLQEIGIGYISVGHRPTIVKYHDLILKMGRGNGSEYTLESVSEDTHLVA